MRPTSGGTQVPVSSLAVIKQSIGVRCVPGSGDNVNERASELEEITA